MKYIRRRAEFIKRNNTPINEQFNMSADGSGPMGNDIVWGDSLVGRLLSSTWRKINSGYQGKKVKGEVKTIGRVLDQILNQESFSNIASSIPSSKLNKPGTYNPNNASNSQSSANSSAKRNDTENHNINSSEMSISNEDIKDGLDYLQISYLLGLLSQFVKDGKQVSFLDTQVDGIIEYVKKTKITKIITHEKKETFLREVKTFKEELSKHDPNEGEEVTDEDILAIDSNTSEKTLENKSMDVEKMIKAIDLISEIVSHLNIDNSENNALGSGERLQLTMTPVEEEDRKILEDIAKGVLSNIGIDRNDILSKNIEQKWEIIKITDNKLYFRGELLIEIDGDGNIIYNGREFDDIESILKALKINRDFDTLTQSEIKYLTQTFMNKYIIYKSNDKYAYGKVSKIGKKKISLTDVNGKYDHVINIYDFKNMMNVFNNSEECIKYIKQNTKVAESLIIENTETDAMERISDLKNKFKNVLVSKWKNFDVSLFKKMLDGDINTEDEHAIIIKLFEVIKKNNISENFKIIENDIEDVANNIITFSNTCKKYASLIGKNITFFNDDDKILYDNMTEFNKIFNEVMKYDYENISESRVKNYFQFINESDVIEREERNTEETSTTEVIEETEIIKRFRDVNTSAFALTPQMINVFMNINNYYNTNKDNFDDVDNVKKSDKSNTGNEHSPQSQEESSMSDEILTDGDSVRGLIIDFQDVLRILKLVNRAYNRFTTPTIPSGRSGGKVSNRTYRQYEYIGTSGGGGGPANPGSGPWRNKHIFNKYYNGIIDLLDDSKYKKIWAKSTIVLMGDGRKVQGGGQILSKFLINSTDGDRFFRAGIQRDFLNKYFGIDGNDEAKKIGAVKSSEVANETIKHNPSTFTELPQKTIGHILNNNLLDSRAFVIKTSKGDIFARSHYFGGENIILTYSDKCKYINDLLPKGYELSKTGSTTDASLLMKTINSKYDKVYMSVVSKREFKNGGEILINKYSKKGSIIKPSEGERAEIRKIYGLVKNGNELIKVKPKASDIDFGAEDVKDYLNKTKI